MTPYFFDVDNVAYTLRKYTSGSGSHFTIPDATLAATTIAGHIVVKASYVIAGNGSLDSSAMIRTIVDPIELRSAVLGTPRTDGSELHND